MTLTSTPCSHCVAVHLSSVHGVCVARVFFYRHEYALQRLVAVLAAKNVENLILFICLWPLDMPLPDDILRYASLSCLYLSVLRFPDTVARPPSPTYTSLASCAPSLTTLTLTPYLCTARSWRSSPSPQRTTAHRGQC